MITDLYDSIEPGSVYYLFCDSIRDQKLKYSVLISTNPILWFLINSEIRKLYKKDDFLESQQIPILREPHHKFLDHNSYIDCAEVVGLKRITYEKLIKLKDDSSCFKGYVHQTIIEEIIRRVTNNNVTISPKHRRLIITNLS